MSIPLKTNELEELGLSESEFQKLVCVYRKIFARFPCFPPRFVYLAGPILGCTAGEANDWRQYVHSKLFPHNIMGISPLRCEPIHGTHYTADYPDHKFGVPRAIAAKNKFDVRMCDITLAVLPMPIPPKTQSYGTLEEIAWADEAGKMTIQVTDDPAIIRHPVVDSARGWKFAAGPGHPHATIEEALDEAIAVCVGVLGGYCGGKNV